MTNFAPLSWLRYDTNSFAANRFASDAFSRGLISYRALPPFARTARVAPGFAAPVTPPGDSRIRHKSAGKKAHFGGDWDMAGSIVWSSCGQRPRAGGGTNGPIQSFPCSEGLLRCRRARPVRVRRARIEHVERNVRAPVP